MSNNINNKILKKLIFELNSTEEFKKIIYKYGEKEEYAENSKIINAYEFGSDFLLYIEKGRVHYTYININGDEQILGILEDGNIILPEAILLDEEEIPFSITAEEPTIIYKIEKNTTLKLLDTNKIFRDNLVKTISINSIGHIKTIIAFSLFSCKDRLSHFLSINIDEKSLTEDGWYDLKQNYTQYDLSIIIGSSRASIAKSLCQLKREGFLKIVNNKIQVKKELSKF